MISDIGLLLIVYGVFFFALALLIFWTWLGRRSLNRRLAAVSDRIDESAAS